ncbi:hypothetical protein MTO96_023681 [Rhipicephalus appendiculatus]
MAGCYGYSAASTCTLHKYTSLSPAFIPYYTLFHRHRLGNTYSSLQDLLISFEVEDSLGTSRGNHLNGPVYAESNSVT